MALARNPRFILSVAAISLCILVAPLTTRLAAEPAVAVDAGASPGGDATSASGAEFVEYSSPYRPRNQFLVGGLLAWTGVLAGGLALLERRLVIGFSLGGGGLVIGLLLMLGIGG